MTCVHQRYSAGPECDDDALLNALRDRDERVFTELVERWSHMMLRLALSHVGLAPSTRKSSRRPELCGRRVLHRQKGG